MTLFFTLLICFLFSALYCGPKEVYLTDIHDPTLSNAAYNARLNAYKDPSEDNMEDGNITIKMTSKADEKFIQEVSILSAVCGDTSDVGMCQMDVENMNISTDTSTTPASLKATSHSTHSTHNGTENLNLISQNIESPVLSTLRVSKVSWSDSSTFPPPADVLIGSDLVYDSKILTLLTQAVGGMLKPGD